jgi:hypothetical protein
MPSHADQRTRATQVARDGIHHLLDAGISFKRIAEASAAAAVQLVLEHADIDDAQDLLVSLHMMLATHAEIPSHGPACP